MATELERRVASLKHGDHVCPIYESTAEQLAGAVPFLQEGLTRNECCVYITADHVITQIFDRLTASGVDVDREQSRGALRIRTKNDFYAQAGEFDPRATIGLLRREEKHALATGFSGCRILAEMSWAFSPEIKHERLLEYEALLNDFLPGSRSLALCQYSREQCTPAIIHDVLRTHPIVIFGDQVCPNPYCEPPELAVMSRTPDNPEFVAKKVDWWIHQLKRARMAEQERERLMEGLQTLSRRLLEVQETERRHLARELHDEVGQMLTGLRMLLKLSGNLAVEAIKTRFDQARSIVDELLMRIRRLSFDLRPAVLDQLGLLPALLALFERYTAQTGVQIHFKHQGIEHRFPSELETTVYRLVQEAITNVARHASVAGAIVRVWATPDTLNAQVEDRGSGFDPEAVLAASRTSGLAGMWERVTPLGGELTVESRSGAGTQITAELPLRVEPRGEPR